MATATTRQCGRPSAELIFRRPGHRLQAPAPLATERLSASILAGAVLALALISSVPHAQATTTPTPGGGMAGDFSGNRSTTGARPKSARDSVDVSGVLLAFNAGNAWQEMLRGTLSLARASTADPQVRVRIERDTYWFTEGETGAHVAVVAETRAGDIRPRRLFALIVEARERLDGASSGDDFASWTELVTFVPGDFDRDGDVWRARREFPVAIVDDAQAEPAEALRITLRSPGGTPGWLELVKADGRTPCAPRGCIVPAFIADNDSTRTGPGPAHDTVGQSHPRNSVATQGMAGPSAKEPDAVGRTRDRPMSLQDADAPAVSRIAPAGKVERGIAGRARSSRAVESMEDMVVVSSIRARSETVVEGSDAIFILTRSSDRRAEASVGVDIRGHTKIMSRETLDLLDPIRPDGMATFAAGANTAEYVVSTGADNRVEGDGELILEVSSSDNVNITGLARARVLVEDDDVPEVSLELYVGGERVQPQGNALRVEVEEAERLDASIRVVCPTEGFEYGPFDWGGAFPWMASERDLRHPIHNSSGFILRWVCNRDDTRLMSRAWTGPTNGEINAQLLTWNPGNWVNELDPTHLAYSTAEDPDRIWFGTCNDEFCPRYRIGSPDRVEITLLNTNPVVAVEALEAEVEEGETAQFRLTRIWPEDRWNLEFIDEELATTKVLLGSDQTGEATIETLPSEHIFGPRQGSVIFELPTVEDDSPDSGERSISIEVLPDTTPAGVNPAGKYDVADFIPGFTQEGGNSRIATVRIREDDLLPQISISDMTAVESESNISFTVSLSETVETDATVNWTVSLGSATPGEDYSAVSGTLHFPAGSSEGAIEIPLIDDQVAEGTETFTIWLSDPVNLSLPVNSDGNPEASATATIEDNDTPSTEVGVILDIHEVNESAGVRGPRVKVSGTLNNAAFAQDTVLQVRVTDGTATAPGDYATIPDVPLVIPARETSGAAFFNLFPVDDSIDEEDETVSVSVLGDGELAIVWNGSQEIVIRDDDTRGVVVSAKSVSVNEGAAATYTVMLASEPTGTVAVVPERTSGDPDVTVAPSLAFAPSNWHVARTVTVSAAEDPDAADDFAWIGHTVSGADYGDISLDPVRVSVIDDETESTDVLLSVVPATVREGTEAVPVAVTARLNSGSRDVDTVVAVSVRQGSAEEGTDFAAVSPFEVTIPADATSGKESFRFLPAEDDLDEPDETVRISGTVSDADLAVAEALLTIEDGDAPPTVNLALSRSTIVEDGGQSRVTATLSHASSVDILVTVSVAPAVPGREDDFVLTGETLTVAAGTTQSAGDVVITAVDNDVDEADNSVTVSSSVAESLGLSDPAPVSLTIADDDEAGISASPAAVQVLEEDASGAAYALVLNSEPLAPVTVSVSGMTGTEVAVNPSNLVFTAVNWNQAREVRVTAAADDDSRNDTVVLEHRASGGGYDQVEPARVAVSVADDDRRIVLTAIPAGLGEGAGETVVTVQAIHAEAASDTDVAVQVSVAGDAAPDPAIAGVDFEPVAGFEIVIAAGELAGTGTFLFTPVDDDLVEEDELVAVTGVSGAMGVSVEGTGIVISDNDDEVLPVLSIRDSAGNENDGSISFDVFLDTPSSSPVRVRYATEDVTALAGIDYEAQTGTLLFQPGEIRDEITVLLHMDPVDEGREQFRVRLSHPVNAELADPEAVGTITNSDPLPGAWLLRFGRAVAEDIAGAVETRARARMVSGVEVEIANQSVGSGTGLAQAGSDTGAWGGGRKGTDGVGAQASSPGAGKRESARSWAVSHEEFLDGTRIAAVREDPYGNVQSFWGSGSVSTFHGSERGVRLDGKVSTGSLGTGYTIGASTFGLLLSRSTGHGGYESESARGEVSARLTGLYPYFHSRSVDHVSIWGVAGFGRGTVRLVPGAGPANEAGIRMAMAAVGTRGVMSTPGGLEVAVETDAYHVRTRSEMAPGLNATDSQATRVRIGLEGSIPLAVHETVSLVPSFGAGLRHDSGDAESGYGIDLGGGVAVRDSETGLSAELQGRSLMLHEAKDYRGWGWSGSLHFDPIPSTSRGLEVSLTTSRGVSASERAEVLRQAESVGGSLDVTDAPATSFEAEVAYGLPAVGGLFTARPTFGIGFSESERTYRTGLEFGLERQRGVGMEIRLEAYQRVRDNGADHGAGLTFRLAW